MDEEQKQGLTAMIKVVLGIVLLTLGIAGVMFCTGNETFANQLLIKVGVTAASNMSVVGVALALHALASHLARRKEAIEFESLPSTLVPALGAYLIPTPFFLLFMTVWGISFLLLGDGTFLELFTTGNLTQVVMLIISAIGGLFSVAMFVYLVFTRVAYSTRAIRVSRPLRRTRTIQWREVKSIVLKRNQYAPVIAVALYTHTGRINVYADWFHSDEWDIFATAVCNAAGTYQIPIRREGP